MRDCRGNLLAAQSCNQRIWFCCFDFGIRSRGIGSSANGDDNGDSCSGNDGGGSVIQDGSSCGSDNVCDSCGNGSGSDCYDKAIVEN